jgi:hypothetical protein
VVRLFRHLASGSTKDSLGNKFPFRQRACAGK